MEPQLGLPDGRADEKDERVATHIAESAVVGKCGWQALAQSMVERFQPAGVRDQPIQPSLPGRIERTEEAGGGRSAWVTRSRWIRHECHHRIEIPEGA